MDEVMGTAEAARRLGVSPQRVRALWHKGALSGRIMASRLLLDRASVLDLAERDRPATRPLSARNTWTLLLMLAGEPSPLASASELSRLRTLAFTRQERTLATLVRARARMMRFDGIAGAGGYVLREGHVVPAGATLAHRWTDLVVDGITEVYATESAAQNLGDRLRLWRDPQGSIMVHVVPDDGVLATVPRCRRGRRGRPADSGDLARPRRRRCGRPSNGGATRLPAARPPEGRTTVSERDEPRQVPGPPRPPVVDARITLAARPDLYVHPDAVARCARTVRALGFEVKELHTSGHRFTRGRLVVDVLAPDHPPRRTALRTVGRRTTVEVQGGTQALQRLELVPVEYAGREALVPIPNLLGALLLKADASHLHDPDRHLLDVAFLTSLATDPLAMRGELTGSDPRRLRAADTHLADADHRGWRALGRERQRAAYATWNCSSTEPDDTQRPGSPCRASCGACVGRRAR
jgi:hypothetical protein